MTRTFRAVVKGAFELAGRGTVVSVEILEGKVAAGDELLMPMTGGSMRLVAVRAVGFVDHEVGRPTQHSYLVLQFDQLPSVEIEVGSELRTPGKTNA